MKKYTIIYSVYVGNNHCVISCDRVKTDDIKGFITQDKYDSGVNFVFERWSPMAADFDDNEKLKELDNVV